MAKCTRPDVAQANVSRYPATVTDVSGNRRRVRIATGRFISEGREP